MLEICKEVIKEKICFTGQKNIDLGPIDSEETLVDGDSNLIGILLGNLVDNAIRYTPPHGQIDIAIRQTQTEILLEVSDTGPGIPEQERERVLERFYRGSHSGIEGSGLGLAIVSRITEQHKARLELLTGSAGHGLLVKIRFPRERSVQALQHG
ncbi:sensor histidine kinase [Chromobacterium alkanivorans]|uniref:sensor histidine kinase n=1 Tax=Chromobacterium alkanivorans TaxID=1071719 RepID=UPI00196875D3|nr:sensor histidine kinase [Chromobacterium alkanivorans]MBN3003733.1 sensor histidine kinase [Chromobacterium alkanivorans]